MEMRLFFNCHRETRLVLHVSENRVVIKCVNPFFFLCVCM